MFPQDLIDGLMKYVLINNRAGSELAMPYVGRLLIGYRKRLLFNLQ